MTTGASGHNAQRIPFREKGARLGVQSVSGGGGGGGFGRFGSRLRAVGLSGLASVGLKV